MSRHSGLIILVLGLVLLSLALSGADCLGQAGSSAPPAAADLKCVTCETTGVTLVWAVDRDDLIGMLRSSSPGWVAVGFSSDEAASSGKMIIGSVFNGRPVVRLKKFIGPVLNPDNGRLLEAYATREQGATVVIFRARLKDLGLVDKIGKTLPVILAKNAAQDDISQYQSAAVGTVKITL
jgi:hypothetical protein